MPLIPVNSTASLVRALQTAHNGDVISVAAGSYAGVVLKNISIAGNVTITSADPNHPAVFTDLMVKNSSGLTFQNLDFVAQAGAANNSFQVSGSSRIAFNHIEMEGPANLGSGQEQSAFMIRGSTGVSVSNSEFHNLWHGLSMLDNDGVTVTGNYFHDIRTDGVRGGGNSNLTVSGNMFTDFYPAPGDHPDAVQIWTTNTTKSASNITVTDNVILRGDGKPMQGIFIQDEVGTLPFKNVTVTGNLVAGAMYNGIAVKHVDGGVVSGNTVLGTADQRSWVWIDRDTGLSVTDNTASDLLFDTDAAARNAANKLALPESDGGAAALTVWLAKHDHFDGAWGDAGAVWSTVGLKPASMAAATAAPFVVVSGTTGADRLLADARFDSRVDGGAGDDVLTGSTKSAQLIGGVGDDTYILKSATDQVVEAKDAGYDTVAVGFDYTLTDNVEAMRMTGNGQLGTGNALDNRLVGSAGDDRLFGLAGDDLLQGGGGNDTLDGGLGADSLRGEAGNDTLTGGDGNDTLAGGDGNDVLLGGNGNDLLEGNTGNDRMTGGAGADTFRFRPEDATGGQWDTITDFHRGEDVISLSLIDANAATAANEAFKLIGTQAFHGVAGELRYEVSGGAAHVYGDLNGDKIADFAITLTGVTTLSASDFVL